MIDTLSSKSINDKFRGVVHLEFLFFVFLEGRRLYFEQGTATDLQRAPNCDREAVRVISVCTNCTVLSGSFPHPHIPMCGECGTCSLSLLLCLSLFLSHSHFPTQSVSYSFTHSFTHSLAHSLTHAGTHAFVLYHT